jgi:hypothetical protein
MLKHTEVTMSMPGLSLLQMSQGYIGSWYLCSGGHFCKMFSNLSGKYQHMCCRYVETNKKWVNDLILKIFSRGEIDP